MTQEKLAKAIVIDGRVLIEQADGSYKPSAEQTDWQRFDAFSEEEIEAMAAEDGTDKLDEGIWLDLPTADPRKEPVFMKLDSDVLAYFKRQGRGYQNRINRVLKHYVSTQGT